MPIGASMAAAAAAAGKENTHCGGGGGGGGGDSGSSHMDGQPRRIGRLISGAKMRRKREGSRDTYTGWRGVGRCKY